jgi:pimeloyl-ACP methyl ester carboxylesterase
MSEHFCEVGGGITICYETFGNRLDAPALLVMGLGTQMIAWHEQFCAQLADQGLYVVRFDNRDVGRSTHIKARPPSTIQLLRRARSVAPYALTDMAEDAAGLLEQLELAPAHVVGASMGGMISQTLAAEHPDKVRSLVSIMSATGSRWTGQPALSMYPLLLRRAPAAREAFVEHAVRLFTKIGSPSFPPDEQLIRDLAVRSYDRGRDADGAVRQLAAIIASGDRTTQLRQIGAPTLVVHGSADRLVSPSGARATARAIRGSRLLTIDGMGHDLPRAIWPRLIEAIVANSRRADRVMQSA